MTLRQRGVLHFIGITVACIVVTAVQGSGSSSRDGPGDLSIFRDGEEASSMTSNSNDETAAYFARGYVSTMTENELRLTIMGDSLLTESVCDGEPMVVLKSTTIPANGACLDAQSRYNLSCSCLSGFANTTAWNFRIRAPDAEPAAPFPRTTSNEEVVQVDSLMLLDAPSNLVTFTIQGDSKSLVPVSLERAATGGDGLSIIRSQQTSSLTKVDLFNLDLADVPIEAGFVPPTITSFAMRRCNLSSLVQPFLESLTALESLNLAENNISSIYSTIPESANALTELNMANNSFTAFPVQLLQLPNLKKLDLSGNDITNFTVTNDELAAISRLSVFSIDTPVGLVGNENDCDDGEWQEIHNTNFCVVNTTTSSSPTPDVVVTGTSGDNSTNWPIFMLVAALGGCLVGFLLFFLATKFLRYQQERRNKTDTPLDAADAQTSRAEEQSSPEAFYNSLHPTLHAELLNDPLIKSFRLKYKDLHVGRCISKGGFGLVYMGMYKHRPVAIKKIMREKCEKLSQIRMFIREITLMGSLKHERIVEFIGVAWDSLRNLSAVTEYMDRGDLRDVLHVLKHQGNNADPGLTWYGKKLTIALHIAEGLAYMHSLTPKVVHRDLKSKNVLLNNDYDAKLSDFGVSRERLVADGNGGPGKFMTPGVGTSFWIAPEVLLGRYYDESADIFSFGVVLSEIDTDDYPYWNSGTIPAQDNADERRSQEQKILEKVALGALRPTFYNDCPPGVLALAANCLEGRPENRPSASEVVLTIKELMREMQYGNGLRR